MPRIAGLLTQLSGAGCVLVGTVAFALLIDQMDGAYLAVLGSWIAAGMLALVCGGIAARPSPAALVVCAALDAGFCGVLFAVAARLSVWLRILSVEDAASASAAVVGIGVAAGVSTLMSLVATPLALRYWRASGEGGASRSMKALQMGGPGTGQMLPSLEPASTAPGFPPPVTGMFQVGPAGAMNAMGTMGTTSDLRQMGPMDSGIMVAPAGTGMPDRKDEPRDERSAKGARVEKTSLPQQPAPPRPAGAIAMGQAGFAPPQSMQPHTGASPYAQQQQPGMQAHLQAGFAPPQSMQPHTGASPYAQQPQQQPVPAAMAMPMQAGFAPPQSMQPHTGASPYAQQPQQPPGMQAHLQAGFAPPQSAQPHTGASPYAPAPPRELTPPAPPVTAVPQHRPETGSQPYGAPVQLGAKLDPQPPLRRNPTPAPAPFPQQLHGDRTPPPYFGSGHGQLGHPGEHPAGHPLGHPGAMPFGPGPHGEPLPGAMPPHGPHGMPGMPGAQAMLPPASHGLGPSYGAPPEMGLRRDPTPPIAPAMHHLEQPAAPRSYRGLWIATAVLAVGGVIGLIILLSGDDSAPSAGAQASTASAAKNDKDPGAKAGGAKAPSVEPAVGGGDEPVKTAGPQLATPRELLDAVHEAARRADTAAIEALAAPKVFGFGMRATSINRTADALSTAFANDLGAPPSRGFTVTPNGVTIGEANGHAWIAEELDVDDGSERRRFAITLLAAKLGDSWRLVAWHWAVRLPDETIERLAEEGDLPIPEGFDDRIEAPKDAAEAFRSAFSSTESYALAISPRESSFNFGSAPGERIAGGDAIRRVFRKLRADIQIREGVMVTANDQWDPAKAAAPDVAWGAANVEFATKSSRRILRVLAVMVKENDEWRLVQTQWSDGG